MWLRFVKFAVIFYLLGSTASLAYSKINEEEVVSDDKKAKLIAADKIWEPIFTTVTKEVLRIVEGHVEKLDFEKCAPNEDPDKCLEKILSPYDELKKSINQVKDQRRSVEDFILFFHPNRELKDASLNYDSRLFKSLVHDYYKLSGHNPVFRKGDFASLLYTSGDGSLKISYIDQRCVAILTHLINNKISKKVKDEKTNRPLIFRNPFLDARTGPVERVPGESDLSFDIMNTALYGWAAYYNYCNNIYDELPDGIEKIKSYKRGEFSLGVNEYYNEINNFTNLIAQNRVISEKIRQRLKAKECCVMHSNYPPGEEYKLIEKKRARGESVVTNLNMERKINSLLKSLDKNSSSIKKIGAGGKLRDLVENVYSGAASKLQENLSYKGDNWFVNDAIESHKKFWQSKRKYLIDNESSSTMRSEMVSQSKVQLTWAIINSIVEIANCGGEAHSDKIWLNAVLVLDKNSQMIEPNLDEAYSAGDLILNQCVMRKPEWSGALMNGINF